MKIGASHTLSLTPLPLTSPSPNTAGCPATVPGRILRLPCGRLAPVTHHTFVLDALKRACRRPSLQPSRSARCALSGCNRLLVKKHKAYSKQRRSRLWSKQVNVRTCGLHYLLALSICGCVGVSELRICPYLAVSGYSRIASYSRL